MTGPAKENLRVGATAWTSGFEVYPEKMTD